MKTQILTASASAVAISLAFASTVSAQSLDYTAMSELFGEPVTAGATGAPQRASDVPATMIIITQDEIRRSPEHDIPGILRHYAGIDFTRYSFGDSQVSIRGAATGYSPRLLVLVNGREVYLDSYGYTSWSTLPVQLEEIQQIEVVKGAQSALYGFNAVGGVINIITRNSEHGDYANMRVNAGDGGYSDAAFTAGRRFGDRASVRLSYGHAEANEFEPYADNIDAVALAEGGYARETGAVQGQFAISDKITLSAEATMSHVQQQEMASIYLAASTVYDLRSFKADLEADTDFGFLTVSGYRNDTEIAYSFGLLESSMTTFRVQDLFKIGTSDTVRLSVEYRSGEANSFPSPGQGDFGYTTWSASAMWNHKFSNALDLTLAGRFDSVEWERDASPSPVFYPFSQDDYAVSFEEFSYNAALVWRPDFGGTMRFATGRGVQAPTMFDIGFTLHGVIGGFPFALSGNPEMDTSIVTNYEIAYDRTLASGIELRTAIFHETTSDIRGVFGTVPDLLPPDFMGLVYLFDNRGDTQTTGAEIGLAGAFGGGWEWDANYTYKRIEDDLAPFPFYTTRDLEGVTPEHLVNGRLGWTGDRLSADAFVNYVSSTDMPLQSPFGMAQSVPIDAYVAASLRASYRLSDHVSVSLTGQNVTFGDGEMTNTNYQPAARYWLSLRAGF